MGVIDSLLDGKDLGATWIIASAIGTGAVVKRTGLTWDQVRPVLTNPTTYGWGFGGVLLLGGGYCALWGNPYPGESGEKECRHMVALAAWAIGFAYFWGAAFGCDTHTELVDLLTPAPISLGTYAGMLALYGYVHCWRQSDTPSGR